MQVRNILSVFILSFVLLSSAAVAQDASSTTKGVTKLSVTPTDPSSPVAVGENDPRINAYRNIVSLGAVGDGQTDNSVTLQNAINAGYAVFIPEGTFNFGSTLILKKDSILLGIGKKSILRYTGTGAALREPIGSYQGGYDNLKLMNFTLTTNSASQAGIELTNNY